MNSLYATGLAFGARVLVNSVIPFNPMLEASAIGIFEGIILYHSRPGTSSFDPTLNPYAAYILRIVFDLLWGLSFSRVAIVVLYTGLSIVVSDLIEASYRHNRHRSSKTRATKTRKSRPRPSDPLPPLDNLLTPRLTAESSLPSRHQDFNDLNPDAAGTTSELHPSGQFEEPSTEVLPDPPFPTSVDLTQQAGQSRGDLEVNVAEVDPFILIDYQTDEDDRIPAFQVTEPPAASTQPVDDVLTAEMPTPIPESQDAADAVDHSAVGNELIPNGPLLTLAPDQNSPQVAQSGLENQPPTTGHDDATHDFSDDHHDTQFPADTTQTSLLDVPLNADPITASPRPAAGSENAVPLPVLVTDNLTAESVMPPISAITDGGSTSRWSREACKVKSRDLKKKARIELQASHRHEAERKKAADGGRLREASLHGHYRDEAIKKVNELLSKARKYDYHADNLDSPAQTIDVHSVDKSYALQKINEQYQQTVQSGEQQLRVIIGGSHGVPSNLSVLPDILQRRGMPCTSDPNNPNVLILNSPV